MSHGRNFKHVFLTIGICVGEAVCKVHFIVVMLEEYLEGKCIQLLLLLKLHLLICLNCCHYLTELSCARGLWLNFVLRWSWIVNDILPSSHPTMSCILTRIYKGFHPVVEEWIWLYKVRDMKSVFLIFSCVRHSEIEPLSEIWLAILISLQCQLVLMRPYLIYSFEVSALETALK